MNVKMPALNFRWIFRFQENKQAFSSFGYPWLTSTECGNLGRSWFDFLMQFSVSEFASFKNFQIYKKKSKKNALVSLTARVKAFAESAKNVSFLTRSLISVIGWCRRKRSISWRRWRPWRTLSIPSTSGSSSTTQHTSTGTVYSYTLGCTKIGSFFSQDVDYM